MKREIYSEAMLFYFWLLIFIFSVIIGNDSNSIATEKPSRNQVPQKQTQDEKNKNMDESSISQENVKLFLNQIEIYGQIAKPQTVFIISGTDPRVDGLRIDRHFFSHIFRPVEKSTLQRVRIKQGDNKDHILW